MSRGCNVTRFQIIDLVAMMIDVLCKLTTKTTS